VTQQRTNKAWWKKRIIRIMEHGYQQHEGEVLLREPEFIKCPKI